MTDNIKQANVIIGHHYYETNLIKTTLIQKSLSLAVSAASELAQDQEGHLEHMECMRLLEQGSMPAMLFPEGFTLENTDFRKSLSELVRKNAMLLDFMVDRFLVSMDFLPCPSYPS